MSKWVSTLKWSEAAQACLTFCDPKVCSLPDSSVHGFSRQEYWSGLPFPSPEDLPDPGIEPGSPALWADALPSEPPGKPSVRDLLLLLEISYTECEPSLATQMVNNLPAMQEIWVWSQGQEDPLEEGMTTHSSIFAWRILWTEESGRLQSIGLQRAGHDWATHTFAFHI